MNWKSQVGQFRWPRQLLLAAGIVATLIVLAIMHTYRGGGDEPPRDSPRQAAWEKITPHLSAADQASAEAADKYATRIQEFFAERKRGARPFADDVLSWSGKWQFVKSKSPWAEDDAYNKYLRETFEQRLFNERELRELIKGAVEAYASELVGIENQTLLAIRADLSDSELAQQQDVLPELRTDEAFTKLYAEIIQKTLPVATDDVGVTAGREISSFIASDIATNITLEILAAVGARLGIQGGILSSGVVSGAATLGIGLVAAIVADMALDWILKQAGYDPAGEIAAKVRESLDSVETLLLQGDPDSGDGGLCRELTKLHEQRSALRREALKKLILEGGVK